MPTTVAGRNDLGKLIVTSSPQLRKMKFDVKDHVSAVISRGIVDRIILHDEIESFEIDPEQVLGTVGVGFCHLATTIYQVCDSAKRFSAKNDKLDGVLTENESLKSELTNMKRQLSEMENLMKELIEVKCRAGTDKDQAGPARKSLENKFYDTDSEMKRP